MNKARLVVAAFIFGAVAVVNGCNSTYWDGVKRRVSRMYNFILMRISLLSNVTKAMKKRV